MIVYLSGLSKKYYDFVPEGFGVLVSFAVPKLYFDCVGIFVDVMLDSGAFSVSRRGIEINRNEYGLFISENNVKNAVNLDVIGNGELSYENWKYFVSKGIKVLPVYHLGDNLDYLHMYASGSGYIGLGGAVGMPPKRIRLYLDKIFSIYPYFQFHLFGCNSIPILQSYPLYSCDSTSWGNGSRLGWVITRYGNFFLNNGRNVPADVEEFLRNKYDLLRLDKYESVARFGEEINKVNIAELNYLLCNQKVEFTKSTHTELF